MLFLPLTVIDVKTHTGSFDFSETEVNYVLISVSVTHDFDGQLQEIVEFINIKVIY